PAAARQSPGRGCVPTQLDLGVDEQAVVLDRGGVQVSGTLRQHEAVRELVTRELELSHAGQGRWIVGTELQRGIEGGLGLRIEGWVLRLAEAGEVGVGELHVSRRRGGVM